MGFIERLTQEREAKERLIAAEREASSRGEVARRNAGARQKKDEEIWSKQQLSQAINYHKESGMPNLFNKLAIAIGGHVWSNVNKEPKLHGGETLPYESGDHFESKLDACLGDRISKTQDAYNSVVCEFLWVGNQDYLYREVKRFRIETYPDGTINFHGGWFGSSIVVKEQWKRDSGILEAALEKVYRHPQKKIYDVHHGLHHDSGRN